MRGGLRLNGPAGARTAGHKGLLGGTAGHKGLLGGTAGHKGLPGGRDGS
jgi:hypothetical protein